MFAAEDLLARIESDQGLLPCRFCLSDDHELTHVFKVSEGRWMLTAQTLRNRIGIPFSGDVDVAVTELLVRCDGRSTLGDAISSVAGRMDLDSETLQPACLAVVRKLLQSGLLLLSTTDPSRGEGRGE